jgi:hypothetical protein
LHVAWNGKNKNLTKRILFYLLTSLVFCLLEYGLLCVSTTASGLSDGQIASAQLGRARVVLSVLRSE